MSKIHVSRDRQTLGQFLPEEVSAGLKSGQFLSTDLGWREGMESWLPLSEFADLPEAPEVPPEPPEVPAVPGAGGIEPAASGAEPTPAWERDVPGGFFGRIVETVKEVLGSPGRAFANVPADGSFLKPLSFYVIVGSVTWAISAIYQLVFALLNPNQLGPEAQDLGQTMIVIFFLVAMLFIPVFITMGSFLWGGLIHLALMLLGGAKGGFGVTYRVVCYCSGSASVFLLIPFCGGLVQLIWNLVATCIGLKAAHKISTPIAVIATLAPLLLCCGLVFAVYAGIIGTVMAGAAAGGAVEP